ncbi:MAG TPA: hypothetical protein VF759_10205 [Allosphingosinicella sp.]|jgi:hypothetical protein
MRNLILLAGTAALALAAPAAADKGGKGGGKGQGGGAAQVERGGGHRGGGHEARGPKPHKAERHSARPERPARAERRAVRVHRPQQAERQALRREERRQDVRREDRREARWERRLGDDRRERTPAWRQVDRGFAGYGRDCPPGLARKSNGCLPPGQAKKLFAPGQRLQRDLFEGYRMPAAYQSFYSDTPDYYYRYDHDGYIYRAERGSDLISAIIPLFGGGFGVGQPLPSGYDVYNVPIQYRDTWYDNDESLYRYGDNAIYRVDSESGLIDGIVALLAGDLNVGQPLPDGYDAYNVPLDYRDEYADDEEHLYRYADGDIYQVDAKTQMIQAIVEMLT